MTSRDTTTPKDRPQLNAKHRDILKERAIPIEIAVAAGLYSVNLADEIAFKERTGTRRYPGLPLHPVEVLMIPYPECSDGIQRWRARPDVKEYVRPGPEPGSHIGEETIKVPRYLCQAGVPVAPYVPPCVSAVAADTTQPIAITEAPLKALSMCGAFIRAMGLGGVMAGAHDRDVLADTRDIVAHADLRRIKWEGRTALIIYDAGMWASSTGEGKPHVALGAAYTWKALAKLGADVRVVKIPYAHPQDWTPDAPGLPPEPTEQGPDDFLYRNGQEALHKRFSEAIPADPMVRVSHAMEGKKPDERPAAVVPLLDELFFRACLHVMEPHERKALGALTRKASIGHREIDAAAASFHGLLVAKQRDQGGTVYTTADNCIWYGDNKLANFSANITEDVLRDDTRIYRISGTLEGGTALPEVEVPAEDFAKMGWVATAWGSRPALAAGRSVPDHVRAAVQEASDPKSRTIYTSTGWHTIDGKRCFLVTGRAIGLEGSDVEVDPPEMGAFRLPDLPGHEGIVEAVRHAIGVLDVAPDTVTVPLVAAAWTAPLELGLDFSVFLVGRTGTFKSSIVALVQSFYGSFDYDSLPANWNSTATFLEARLHRAKDVPFPVDNYVPPEAQREFKAMQGVALRTLQAIGDGQGRGRCDSRAVEREVKRPRALLIGTGEVLPPTNESTLGRLVVLRVDEGDISLDAIRKVRASVDRLGIATHAYLQHLAESIEGLELEGQFARWRELFSERLQGDCHQRLPTSLAKLMVGFETFTRFAEGLGVLDTVGVAELNERAMSALLEVAADQPVTEDATAAESYLDAIRALLRSRRAGLADSPASALNDDIENEEGFVRTARNQIGWLAGDTEVFLEPALTFVAVADFMRSVGWNYSKTECHRQLKAGGVLTATDGRHATVQRVVAGSRCRVLVLQRDALADALSRVGSHLRAVDGDDDSAVLDQV